LETLGIKEYLLTWRQLFDQIKEGQSEDENDESIKKLLVIIQKLPLLNKDLVISLLLALFNNNLFKKSKNSLRSKLVFYQLFEVI
jgi:hypothetical protein